MKGIDYLRSIVRQRKLATGGIISAECGPELISLPTCGRWEPNPMQQVTLTIDNRDGAYTAPAEPGPAGFIRIDHTLVVADAEQIRQRFQTALTHKPSWNSDCDCWPQYINCCCDVRKRRKQQ